MAVRSLWFVPTRIQTPRKAAAIPADCHFLPKSSHVDPSALSLAAKVSCHLAYEVILPRRFSPSAFCGRLVGFLDPSPAVGSRRRAFCCDATPDLLYRTKAGSSALAFRAGPEG
jgi:hypothetical protein